MKKILSLALVLLMVVGVAAPAFAFTGVEKTKLAPYVVTSEDVFFDTNSTTTADITASLVFKKSDGVFKLITTATWDANVKPGNTIAFEIKAVDGTPHKDIKSSDINKYKAFFESNRGNFDSITIESVKVAKDPSNGVNADKYIWAVVVKIPDTQTASVDISGTIAIAKSKTAAKSSAVYFNFGQDTVYGNVEGTPGNGSYTVKSNNVLFKAESDETDVDFTFGNDVALFEVNASGQGKVNLKFNTDFNKEFGDIYPNANLEFVTFTKNPVFNKTGVLTIYADKDTFIYGVGADGVVELNATYDEQDEAWKIKTRTLGAYVISDKELAAPVVAPEVTEPEVEAPVKENPSTGR